MTFWIWGTLCCPHCLWNECVWSICKEHMGGKRYIRTSNEEDSIWIRERWIGTVPWRYAYRYTLLKLDLFTWFRDSERRRFFYTHNSIPHKWRYLSLSHYHNRRFPMVRSFTIIENDILISGLLLSNNTMTIIFDLNYTRQWVRDVICGTQMSRGKWEQSIQLMRPNQSLWWEDDRTSLSSLINSVWW